MAIHLSSIILQEMWHFHSPTCSGLPRMTVNSVRQQYGSLEGIPTETFDAGKMCVLDLQLEDSIKVGSTRTGSRLSSHAGVHNGVRLRGPHWKATVPDVTFLTTSKWWRCGGYQSDLICSMYLVKERLTKCSRGLKSDRSHWTVHLV